MRRGRWPLSPPKSTIIPTIPGPSAGWQIFVARSADPFIPRACPRVLVVSQFERYPLVFRLPASTWRRATASMMAGLKSPTMNRQDRQMRTAIKRNPSPNEMRPPRLGIGPKPQNARIAKSKATAVHNILKNIAPSLRRYRPSYARGRFGCGRSTSRWSLRHCHPIGQLLHSN
jgi:hypothetical protein